MTHKAPFDRITIELDKMGGEPCIRGMRLTVRRVIEILAAYPERKELFLDFPFLQALAFASHNFLDVAPLTAVSHSLR